MILSNVELHNALDSKRLVIDPEPQPRFLSIGGSSCPYDTHSVDLTLHDEISVSIDKDPLYAYDLMQPGSLARFIANNSEKRALNDDSPYALERGKFILGMTREKISLPIFTDNETCLAARIEGKSSRARCGLLIHFTAPTVHPGWEGWLTLEMINLGPAPILLRPGMPLAQLIVEEVRRIPVPNASEFQGQSTPEGVT